MVCGVWVVAVTACFCEGVFAQEDPPRPPRPEAANDKTPAEAPAENTSAKSPTAEPSATEEATVSAATVTGPIVIHSLSGRHEVAAKDWNVMHVNADGLERGEERICSAADLLYIRFPWPRSRPRALEGASGATVRLLLRSGDELVGIPVAPARGEGTEDTLTFATRSQKLTLALESIRGFVVERRGGLPRPDQAAALRQRRLREEVRSAATEDDEVRLVEGAAIRGLISEITGTDVAVDSETLGDLRIPFDKIDAVIVAAIEDEENERATTTSTADLRVELVDGSRLLLGGGTLTGGVYRTKHSLLDDLEVSFSQVREIGFLNGRARYLSDLKPQRSDERPGTLTISLPHQRDLNVLGEPMRMKGEQYSKGLGVHSYSLLEFDLDGEYRSFRASVGLDESARPIDPRAARKDVGSVVFRVYADGKKLFEKAMTWRDDPADVDVSVADAKLLRLEVDYGGGDGLAVSSLDRANWANAMVIR